MENNFIFQLKTKIYFGKNQENNIGNILNEYDFKKVLIIIGKSSVIKSGLLERVTNSLENYKVSYKVCSGVRSNPSIQLANEFVEVSKQYKPDAILAIGGGSVIDTAKYVSVGYYYDGNAFDFNKHISTPTKALPIGVILTISASGSESSTSCVMQDDDSNKKCGFNSELVRPLFAIENPELTFSVDKQQTINGIVDIMMHTLERYFHDSWENEPSDYFAEGLLKSVMKAGRDVLDNPNNYEARSTLMIMGSMSHNGFTSIGKSSSLDVHQLEHAVSGLYPDVAHGAGLSILLPSWMEVYKEVNQSKFARLAENVFDLHGFSQSELANLSIEYIKKYFREIGAPLSFSDIGINPDIDKLVKLTSNDGTRVVSHPRLPMNEAIMKKIFELSR